MIHQLVLVCWRAVPQTISFYNPKPSYIRSSLMAYAKRCRDVAALSRRGCTATLLRCGYIVALLRRGYTVVTLRHGSTAETNLCTLLLCCRIQAMTLSPPQATSSRWSQFVRILLVEPIN